jgi:ferric-dicitrate binding protein FerR (iron transport regulator)
MTTRHADERALAALVAEARQDAPVMPDWAGMEQRLMEGLAEARPRETSRANRGARALAGAAAALAAGLALFVGSGAGQDGKAGTATVEHSLPEQHPAVAAARNSLPAVGAAIDAPTGERTLDHAGHANWTLERGGLARLEAVGDVVAIELQRGALRARVVPKALAESFVVRVGSARIAVHGTAFRVERSDDGVSVAVTEGVVAIGPVGGPAFEVSAPGTARVSLAGLRIDAARPAGTETKESPDSRSEAASQTDVSRAAGKRTTTPGVATPTVDDVLRVVRGCLANNTVARGDLSVSVRTRLSMRVLATGQLDAVEFAPPVAPAVRRCVDGAVAGMQLGQTEAGFDVVRTVELSH